MAYSIYDKTAAINRVRLFLGLSANGTYDIEVIEKIKSIQKKSGLLQSGIVDYETFKLLVQEYNNELIKRKGGEVLFGENNFPFRFGNRGNNIILLNTMLREVLQEYTYEGDLPTGAFYSRNTENSVSRLRKVFGLKDSNTVDEEFLYRLKQETEANKLTY